MSNVFHNRVFGAVIIKSINSNFNADFTHHPRTLPDGTVYATDKALKYAVKDYFRKNLKIENLFYIKRLNANLNPNTLDETYTALFGEFPKTDGKNKSVDKLKVLKNLLKCPDIRLFGATFAGETNISIHGPLQINHAVNKFPENEIYTEDILSPFRNPGKEGADEKAMSTIGNQSNLKEGHYVYHFSINPFNLAEYGKILKDDSVLVSEQDIINLKSAFNSAVTQLDSSRKIGTENEATLWVELKAGSNKVMPSFTELIEVSKDSGQIVLNLTKAAETIDLLKEDIQKVEFYFNPAQTKVLGLKEGLEVKFYNILKP